MHPAYRPLTVLEEGGLADLIPQQSATSDPTATVLQAARDLLLAELSAELLDPVAPSAERDPEVLRVLRSAIGAHTERGGPLAGFPTDDASLLRLFHDTIGWGPAQPYLDDERIQEVKIIGDQIMVQEDGADFTLAPERFSSPRQALDRALVLASRLAVPLDRSRPQDTLPLAHGTRMHVTIPPCTPDDTALICIRRGRRTAWTLADILRRGACDETLYAVLHLLVRARCSFLIAGETGCGKTALLEAIVNSWPGEPHVITIEDNTLEINVRHAAWTRELVQTSLDPQAFGRAAREVLRQTPSLVAPGETRAAEAGAILAVAVSGHAVVTTIHARNTVRAVSRLADCAAMPGAYLYEGRRTNALEDICDNFQVVIHLARTAGRRYINEVALLDGCEETASGLRPTLIRLAWAEPVAEGIRWHCSAQVQDDRLVWEGADRTPETLLQRFALLKLTERPRAVASSRAAVDDALAQAALARQTGASERALAILRRAWSERQDERLVQAARHVLAVEPVLAQAPAVAGRTAYEQIGAALAARRWHVAAAVYAELSADLDRYAAFSPPGGWPMLAAAITAGQQADQAARTDIQRAEQALAQGRPRDALDLIAKLEPARLSDETALALLRTRYAALNALVATGEVSDAALIPVVAALRMREAAQTHA
ncbi:ATPase, T2SS/T4P/T4SS family [Chloroflexus aggregans]|uniref:Type II secretion system protein E n=1 Tax=Chloroflexus aggregans (strain MD-66 / DSM 9485) TaxID=326427 RepID=B8GAP4_CHLAD|nr:ATPase, T2SS/T4P/T4SS family [Chloroflexus aggregans]ACL24633.1 type II secretion system protein E [Chloroflexus aggregans DSM 9485]